MLAKRSSFTLVFFKDARHVNPGAEKKRAGLSPYVSRHIFRKLLNTSVSNNVSLRTYKSWYSPNAFISKSLQTLFTCV